MSIIKSFAVGNGDMYYIEHNTDNFTIVDCSINESSKKYIIPEIKRLSSAKGITRFISTHPDEDHIGGIALLDEATPINNFYCVKNQCTKEEETESFKKYCELRDDTNKAFYIQKGCTRCWMNQSNKERDGAGIHVLWPNIDNKHFKEVLAAACEGESPNNLSPIIQYRLQDGASVLWFGDLETDFMELVEDELDLPRADIVFAPHHGRDSGKIPNSLLDKMKPKIIVLGEAPSRHINYYTGYHTLTQNSTDDIVFDCVENKVHIFTWNKYEADFLVDEAQVRPGFNYAGTLLV